MASKNDKDPQQAQHTDDESDDDYTFIQRSIPASAFSTALLPTVSYDDEAVAQGPMSASELSMADFPGMTSTLTSV